MRRHLTRKIYDLVDKNECIIGLGTKSDAVRLGLWRRVVHVFVFNKRGWLLICKRPSQKHAYPNLWTSSAGGHVERGESYKNAVRRELKEELGLQTRLTFLGKYYIKSTHGKIIHGLFMTHAEKVSPDPREVSICVFQNIKQVARDVAEHPKRYVYPFRKALELYLKQAGSA